MPVQKEGKQYKLVIYFKLIYQTSHVSNPFIKRLVLTLETSRSGCKLLARGPASRISCNRTTNVTKLNQTDLIISMPHSFKYNSVHCNLEFPQAKLTNLVCSIFLSLLLALEHQQRAVDERHPFLLPPTYMPIGSQSFKKRFDWRMIVLVEPISFIIGSSHVQYMHTRATK